MIFLDTSDLKNEEIALRLDHTFPGDPARNRVPAYYFDILDAAGQKVGTCDLRIGHNEGLYYGGNIGYAVDESFRGHQYAEKACRLLFELARRHEMDYLMISCQPTNLPSRRTCERLGGKLLEIAELPPDNDMRINDGHTHECIFRFELSHVKARKEKAMPFDYKKEYKEFYLPKDKPSIVTVPPMNYVAVRGKGDPNEEDGEYQAAIGLLYGIAYTIKMSKKGSRQIEGYFDYVVPPLEGFWWQEGVLGVDYAHKERFEWISLIRLPDFVTKADFDWAVEEAARKKKTDFSKAELLTYDEGLCVQCMHLGPYDKEPATVERMHQFMAEHGCVLDIKDSRYHHEIYLSDARKTPPEKLKTVIRHPIRKAD